jgi:peptidoglycan hydrolase-like protein with peptidoglycan-binding domain
MVVEFNHSTLRGLSMANQSYAVPDLVLGPGNGTQQQIRDLQTDLRSLGYLAGPVGGSIDGQFGPTTTAGVMALQIDLMQNNGASTQNSAEGAAPVAVTSYNDGSVTAATGTVSQSLVAIIGAMLDDANYPKLPSSPNPASDNAAAVAAVKAMSPSQVPIPYLLAILSQESGQMHYQVPRGVKTDNYVTLGLDHNDRANPSRVTSRGYGMGQYTFFHHPPTPSEVQSSITDAVGNARGAAVGLLNKFHSYILGPADVASDRIAEFNHAPLRVCQYMQDDARYMSDCKNCMAAAPKLTITSGQTPTYANSGQTYEAIAGHVGSYNNVPDRTQVGCDWPYAARRYNGSGPASFDYQAEVLLKVLNE